MSNAGAAQEPSMEEILASIRKIISDDSEPEPVEAAPLPADASKDAQSMIDDMFEDGAAAGEDAIEAIMAGARDVGAPDVDARVADTRIADTRVADDDEGEGEEHGDEQVLELTEDMVAEPLALVEGLGDEIDFGDAGRREEPPRAARPEPAPAPAPEAAGPARKSASAAIDEKLISRETEQAVSSAFSSLAGMMLSNNARTLEDLVSDMLRPMLKTWLDDNLPGLVEKIVRSEIERVTRGGR